MAQTNKPKRTLAKKVTAKPLQRRFCSVKKSPPIILSGNITGERARLIVQNVNKWANGTTLYYYFFDKKTDGAYIKFKDGTKEWRPWKGSKNQTDVVRRAFKIWKELGIGLDFKEVKTREEADIRIAFMQDDGSWSYIGRDIRRKRKDPRTMNFGWNVATRDRHNGIDTVLHEIGHTLGFPHEHQNPFAGIVWNKKAVYESLAAEPNEWSKEETDFNIIDKLSKREVNGSTWDPDSIMHYPFEKGLIIKPEEYANKDLEPAGGLSPQDIEYALTFYPAQNVKKDINVSAMASYNIDVKNTEQQNYIFIPGHTKKYTIQTIGEIDTVMVLSEKINNELKYIAGDDNSGTDKNALISATLTQGKTYIIKVKVYYKKPDKKTALMIS
ncbi:MAG TPA: M12 family metallopeptidase [Chitinophagaceae bacterium]|nr:M12 family metallopeptidase [Chitinophagaceae bacterium]